MKKITEESYWIAANRLQASARQEVYNFKCSLLVFCLTKVEFDILFGLTSFSVIFNFGSRFEPMLLTLGLFVGYAVARRFFYSLSQGRVLGMVLYVLCYGLVILGLMGGVKLKS